MSYCFHMLSEMILVESTPDRCGVRRCFGRACLTCFDAWLTVKTPTPERTKPDILENVRAILQRDIGRFLNKHPLRKCPRPQPAQPARRSASTLVPLSALDKSMIFAEGHSAAMPPNFHLANHCHERGDLIARPAPQQEKRNHERTTNDC